MAIHLPGLASWYRFRHHCAVPGRAGLRGICLELKRADVGIASGHAQLERGASPPGQSSFSSRAKRMFVAPTLLWRVGMDEIMSEQPLWAPAR